MKTLCLAAAAGLALAAAAPFTSPARAGIPPRWPVRLQDDDCSPPKLPSQVTTQVRGKLTSRLEPLTRAIPGYAEASAFDLPGTPEMARIWQVTVNGTVYELDLRNLCRKSRPDRSLQGLVVQINGRVELHSRVRRLATGPTIEANTIQYQLEHYYVIVVDSFAVIMNQKVPDQAQTEVRSVLRWHGNQKFKGPNGEIIWTKKYYEWEGYYLDVNGRQIRLQFAGEPSYDDLDPLVGKTVVVKGTLELRYTRPQPPGATPSVYEVLRVKAYSKG